MGLFSRKKKEKYVPDYPLEYYVNQIDVDVFKEIVYNNLNASIIIGSKEKHDSYVYANDMTFKYWNLWTISLSEQGKFDE
ncbi:MAG: hypothetical protein IJV48_00450 [Ruminococcus sp.]|nr:hypothetical protein [Ruminococcus sp.]